MHSVKRFHLKVSTSVSTKTNGLGRPRIEHKLPAVDKKGKDWKSGKHAMDSVLALKIFLQDCKGIIYCVQESDSVLALSGLSTTDDIIFRHYLQSGFSSKDKLFD